MKYLDLTYTSAIYPLKEDVLPHAAHKPIEIVAIWPTVMDAPSAMKLYMVLPMYLNESMTHMQLHRSAQADADRVPGGGDEGPPVQRHLGGCAARGSGQSGSHIVNLYTTNQTRCCRNTKCRFEG
jgi:hypothetical protein